MLLLFFLWATTRFFEESSHNSFSNSITVHIYSYQAPIDKKHHKPKSNKMSEVMFDINDVCSQDTQETKMFEKVFYVQSEIVKITCF